MEFDLQYDYRPDSVERLIQLVRLSGNAGDWQGQPEIAEAVVGVFADPNIAGMRSKQALDNYAVVATTSWILEVINQDEHFSGSIWLADLLGGKPPPEAWRLPPDEAVQLVAQTAVIVRRYVRQAPHIASLAAYLVWGFTEDAALRHEFQEAVAVGRVWFAGRAPVPWGHSGDVIPREPHAAVVWLRQAASGPRPPAIYDKVFGDLAVDKDIVYFYVEFGYAALWRHPQAAVLAQLCEEALSWAREDDGRTLTPEEDEFLGRILADRLCKMSAPHSWGGVRWKYVIPEALGPIADLVSRRAYSVQTRDIARRLLTLMTLFNAAGVLPVAGWQIRDFSRVLYSRVWPVMAILGSLTALISLAGPWWLANAIGLVGLYLCYRMIRHGRIISKYTLSRYPKDLSIISSAVIGGTYWASMTGLEFALAYPQYPVTDLVTLPPSFAVYIVIIGCIIRYPGDVEMPVSNLLPDIDGIPDTVMDSFRDKIDEVFESPYLRRWPRPRHKKSMARRGRESVGSTGGGVGQQEG
jgi:hypothetical protein